MTGFESPYVYNEVGYYEVGSLLEKKLSRVQGLFDFLVRDRLVDALGERQKKIHVGESLRDSIERPRETLNRG